MYTDYGLDQVPMVGPIQWLTVENQSPGSKALMIPFGAAVLSAAALVVHGLETVIASRFRAKPECSLPAPANHIASFGGRTIFSIMVLRFLCTVALFILQAFTLVDLPTFYVTIPVLYTSLLAVSALVIRPSWSTVITRHYNATILATFCVYFYRDIFPLATFNLPVQDLHEGKLLWTKLVLLGFLSVVLPLAIPRPYIPVDPENPSSNPAPEQTASIFSLATFSYLDSLVFRAYQQPRLSLDELPPLADFDRSHHLKEQVFPHVDVFAGAPKRHLFWGLIRAFWREYVWLITVISTHVAFMFASPIALNRLLEYIETGGEDAFMRPYVWILLLIGGPLISSLALQSYNVVAIKVTARLQALLTQLVFEHSLRIRFKATSATASEEHVEPSAPEDTQLDKGNLIGKINNLVSSDLDNIAEARDFILVVFLAPVQTILCIVFLYNIIGWSAFVGLGVLIVLMPLPGLVAKVTHTVQEGRMKKTDGRVQSVTEIMSVLRMVKLFGWESKMAERVALQREGELTWIKYRQYLDVVNEVVNFVIPIVTMIFTYAAFTVVMNRELSAAIVFSSMTVFDMLRDNLHQILSFTAMSIAGKVSLDRMNDFLQNTELIDAYAATDTVVHMPGSNINHEIQIGVPNASFVWSNDSDGSLTPPKRKFILKMPGKLAFKEGGVNLIIGPTGSGKTSLLMALLGEMHLVSSGGRPSFNLLRANGVAYSAQESWVQNETIKANIVFGAPFDEARYHKVLYQCGLERDISLFEAGDDTEVGEKGLTLSGGQKARVTLARAIYSDAETILLDDVLAALDVHTAKWIVEKCFAGDLVKGRTLILATHNIALTSPIADYIVSLKDGHIEEGTASDMLGKSDSLMEEAKKEEDALAKTDEQVDHPEAKDPSGRLIVDEEMEEGRVGWPALKLWFSAMGGNHYGMYLTGVNVALLVSDTFGVSQAWWVGRWASQYHDDGVSDTNVPVFYYLGIYGAFTCVSAFFYCVAVIVYLFGMLRASRSLHKQLVASVLGTTLRWLDTTPTSRIIARCTQDIRAVDGPLAMSFQYVLEILMMMVAKFFAIVIVTPAFLVPSAFVAFAGYMLGQMYIKVQLSVKRHMSIAKAPVLAHFGATISGLTSVRAYGAQQAFMEESLQRIDAYTRMTRISNDLNRWIGLRIDLLGAVFAASLATYLVYFRTQNAGTVGFALNMAIAFSSHIIWLVRFLNMFEVQGNSLERIQQYIAIEQEPASSALGQPPAYWPASGSLRVKNLSAKYSPDGPNVLHDISFEVKSGERVGIVGRTGSGKSSLTLSLLKCIPTEGDVYLDGLPTSSVNLDALRTSVTIIPQMPELLSGTLRQNLDPFDQYDDATLNDALRASGLFSLQEQTGEGSITLDNIISSGGGNFSVGQRQIIALARAIVRGSKLLILDEATSAIDYKTDAIIQSSLRHELKGDITLITVAHRLQTIMDADKIMVLDAGNIVEFDSPAQLLANEKGFLRSLVDDSNDKATLYAMAEGKSV